MSVLNDEEQEIFEIAKSSVPRQMFPDNAVQELFGAAAKVFGSTKTQLRFWFDSSYILNAAGFWLDQHARDRGTRRRDTETDNGLQSRLRNVEDTITPNALEAVANEILVAEGIAGVVHLIELRSGAHQRFGGRVFFHPTGTADPPGRSYLSRGERITRNFTHRMILIMPYGTTTAAANSIIEAVTRRIAAGQAISFETRAIP